MDFRKDIFPVCCAGKIGYLHAKNEAGPSLSLHEKKKKTQKYILDCKT